MTEHDRFMKAEENLPLYPNRYRWRRQNKRGETYTGAHSRNCMREQVNMTQTKLYFARFVGLIN